MMKRPIRPGGVVKSLLPQPRKGWFAATGGKKEKGASASCQGPLDSPAKRTVGATDVLGLHGSTAVVEILRLAV